MVVVLKFLQLVGDLDDDGDQDCADFRLLLADIADTPVRDHHPGDLNENNKIDIEDAVLFRQYFPYQPVCAQGR